MRISRFIALLFISLFVSPIFFSHVVAKDIRITDDETTISPNNIIVMYYCWRNLAVKERVAYRSNFSGFEVLNVSNPKTVDVITAFQLEDNVHSGYLVLNETLLFLSVERYENWSVGFQIIDVANNNTSISQFFFNTSLDRFSCYGIYVKGRYVYYLVNHLESELGGFLVADCSNITRPVEVGSYFFVGSWFQELVIYNNYAYLLKYNTYENYDYGIQIIDLTNTSSLLKIGEVLDSVQLNGVKCHENKLYLVNHNGKLRIYDIADPTNPQQISYYSEEDASFQDVYISGDIAYIVKVSGCSILDISEILSLKKIGNFKYTKEPGAFRYGFVEDGLLYLHKHSVDPERILFILDVSNPEKLTRMYPSWIAPKWANNEIALFLFYIITPTIVIGIIVVFTTLIVKRRRRRRKL